MRIKYTKEILEPIIKESKTWAEVCRKLGLKPMTGSQTHIKKRATKFNINFTHFVGKSFNAGRTFKRKDALEYCYNGSKIISHRLKLILIRDGYKNEKCENCNNTKWLNKKIPLELHHIDGNHFNNEFNNLRILCPNCHSLAAIEIKENKKIKANKIKVKKINFCKCGKIIQIRSKKCEKCHQKSLRKVKERPTYEELINSIESMGYCATGRKYGVSDNTIRKWVKVKNHKNMNY